MRGRRRRTSGAGGGGSSFTVSHVPLTSSAAAPSGGWNVILADAFAPTGSGGNAIGATGSFWGPNRHDNNGDGGLAPVAGFNSDEVEMFSSTQVALQAGGGVNLTSVYDPGVGTTQNYLSGCLSSQPSSVPGGTTGFPNITGFGFKVTTGQVILFERRVQLFPFLQGMDWGDWSIQPAGANEIDFIENEFFAFNAPGHSGQNFAWFGTSNTPGNEIFDASWATDGNLHTFATLLDGVNSQVKSYVDNTLITAVNYAWPTTFSTANYNCLLMSLAWRNVVGWNQPTQWTTGSHSAYIKSYAIYGSSGYSVGAGNIVGGGTAAGTTLV